MIYLSDSLKISVAINHFEINICIVFFSEVPVLISQKPFHEISVRTPFIFKTQETLHTNFDL